MTIFSKKAISTLLSAAILSTAVMTSVNVSSAEAGMRGERYHHGHRGIGTAGAIGLGIFGALAVISAVQAAKNSYPAHVKRRCAQASEWAALADSARKNARIQRARGDKRGAREWRRDAKRRDARARAARRDCKRWKADYR